MALIWVEGCTGEKALAPLWRDFALAQSKQSDMKLSAQERGQAMDDSAAAKKKYDTAVTEATLALKKQADAKLARTHVLIVGVAEYDDPATFPTVDTSVYGARQFADWMLTRFVEADRPLGSLALVTSPAAAQGDWMPAPAAAELLGLPPGSTLPTPKATLANIKQAFEGFLRRAETFADNAAIYYFAGHGIYKSEPLALPQDAQLPDETRGAKNIIAHVKTMNYMQNRQPAVQCFFIDTCSEKSFELMQSVQELPGEALINPKNGEAIEGRDANIFLGSYPGKKALGPDNAAPFFTQELLLCLEKRASDPTVTSSEDSAAAANYVTSSSLAAALYAAGSLCTEREKKEIMFAHTIPGPNTFNARLCQITPSEVLVRVNCRPPIALGSAKLYVQSGVNKINREMPRNQPWCTTVPKGTFIAGADFDPPSAYINVKCSKPIAALPPVHEVLLTPVVNPTGRKP
jgi:hypothetical protein